MAPSQPDQRAPVFWIHGIPWGMTPRERLRTAQLYLDKKETQERLRRTESSSQLCGLIPREARETNEASTGGRTAVGLPQVTSPFGSVAASAKDADYNRQDGPRLPYGGGPSPRFTFDLDSTFLGLNDQLPRTPDFEILGESLDSESQQAFGALNLFPLLETGGHIDLAHSYF